MDWFVPCSVHDTRNIFAIEIIFKSYASIRFVMFLFRVHVLHPYPLLQGVINLLQEIKRRHEQSPVARVCKIANVLPPGAAQRSRTLLSGSRPRAITGSRHAASMR